MYYTLLLDDTRTRLENVAVRFICVRLRLRYRASISCGFVLQQVVRLAVRLAACRKTYCGLAVGFPFVGDLSYSLQFKVKLGYIIVRSNA